MKLIKFTAIALIGTFLLTSCGAPLVKRTMQAPARALRTVIAPLY